MEDPLDEILDSVEADRLENIGGGYEEFGGVLYGSEHALYNDHGGFDPVTGLSWLAGEAPQEEEDEC